MSTELLEQPDTTTNDDDPEVAHYVLDPAKVAEAYVNGTPVQALCGKLWVPSKSPRDLPLCTPCKQAAERGGYRTEGVT